MRLTKDFVTDNTVNPEGKISLGVMASKLNTTVDPEKYEAKATKNAYVDSAAYADIYYLNVTARDTTTGAVTAATQITDIANYDLCTRYVTIADKLQPVLSARNRKTQEIVYADIILADQATYTVGTTKIIAEVYHGEN